VSLGEAAIAAHGGLERWRQLTTIDVSLRCGGIAMPFKGQPEVLRSFTATADMRRPHVELHGIAHEWIDGLLIPTRRRVTPRGVAAPTLVSIDIDSLHAT
jgi:hypothetical protein